MYTGKRILITGGTGSWGQILAKRLLNNGATEVRIFSRNEAKQVEMKRIFDSEKLSFYIGDVRDLDRLSEVSKDIDILFHLAALKHVPICEEFPEESIKTNIIGAQNVIKAAKNNYIAKVIYISTDKAVAPLNSYGMCKGLAEKLFIQANKNSKTKYITIRAGNVLNTSGSVIPFFLNKIKNKENLPVTDMDMTRFYITLEQAIDLVMVAANSHVIGGELFVVNMPSFSMKDILKLVDSISSYEGIDIIGLRPGEKLHEVLISEDECPLSYIYSADYIVIIPPWTHISSYYKNNFYPYNKVMSSKTNLKEYNKLEELYTQGRGVIYSGKYKI